MGYVVEYSRSEPGFHAGCRRVMTYEAGLRYVKFLRNHGYKAGVYRAKEAC